MQLLLEKPKASGQKFSKILKPGSCKSNTKGTWTDLENLPFPRRDILRNPYYQWGSIQTSRGCPMNCTFCSVTAFNGRRFRRRPLDAVIEELEQIPQKKILLTDDNIIGHGKQDLEWTRNFFLRILEKGIKKIFFAQSSILFGEDPELIRLASRAGVKNCLYRYGEYKSQNPSIIWKKYQS